MLSLRQAYYHRAVALNSDGSELATEQTTSWFESSTGGKVLVFAVRSGSSGQDYELETFSEMSGF